MYRYSPGVIERRRNKPEVRQRMLEYPASLRAFSRAGYGICASAMTFGNGLQSSDAHLRCSGTNLAHSHATLKSRDANLGSSDASLESSDAALHRYDIWALPSVWKSSVRSAVRAAGLSSK